MRVETQLDCESPFLTTSNDQSLAASNKNSQICDISPIPVSSASTHLSPSVYYPTDVDMYSSQPAGFTNTSGYPEFNSYPPPTSHNFFISPSYGLPPFQQIHTYHPEQPTPWAPRQSVVLPHPAVLFRGLRPPSQVGGWNPGPVVQRPSPSALPPLPDMSSPPPPLFQGNGSHTSVQQPAVIPPPQASGFRPASPSPPCVSPDVSATCVTDHSEKTNNLLSKKIRIIPGSPAGQTNSTSSLIISTTSGSMSTTSLSDSKSTLPSSQITSLANGVSRTQCFKSPTKSSSQVLISEVRKTSRVAFSDDGSLSGSETSSKFNSQRPSTFLQSRSKPRKDVLDKLFSNFKG